MLRINRNSGRKGCDGRYRTWDEIEALYIGAYEKKIADKLDEAIKNKMNKDRHNFLCMCRSNVHKWLLAKPDELPDETIEIDKAADVLSKDDKDAVWEVIKGAFDYTHNRPVDLANWLNVKTCPYCNMQYTLYTIETDVDSAESEEKAVFQFDHFIPQTEYPMFSMSLYNLIPSCASCNNGKNKGDWSLEYHPYYREIKDKIHFRVKDPLPLLVGREKDIEIEAIHPEGEEWQKYEKATHVAALYKRHNDVAQDVFARVYNEVYYRDVSNFGFIGDAKFTERVRKGFYPDEDDIDKRPLTKLQQDLWKQAKEMFSIIKTIDKSEQ